ncbi:hypothetical protein [Myceligenerans pegani]|uniref:Uncharacterized protein n=1 Tax=Myceligenerans pegani TaxID=2776917 RepID=A0ABR9N2P5_9MICO|nr:hypothetical protein [Myceligenerans sp. TRM 65318]MBE1877917.1 hypothetical protein [Myceligenerans sp. TRM 65318]MBE3020188.1 hypothetical protein [Myceligenerans sp. TRM 65318]
MESRSCVEARLAPPPSAALHRPAIERLLDDALWTSTTGMTLLRGPRGSGRRTAVALWTQRLVRGGRAVVHVDLSENDAADGEMLGAAVRTGLLFLTGAAPAAPSTAEGWTPEDVAATLDAHEVVLVVDRLGPASGAALRFLDRAARLLRGSHVVALTAMPLRERGPAGAAHVELDLRALRVSADEARWAAVSLGLPLSDRQTRLLTAATAGWPAMFYPALHELHRASVAGDPVTDTLVSVVAATHRAAFLRDAMSDEALAVLVEASRSARFTWHDLEGTGLLSMLPEDFLDRLVDTGVVLEDPTAPDGMLAVEPNLRRALLDAHDDYDAAGSPDR